MPTFKVTLGLGALGADSLTFSQGGRQVNIFTGSFFNNSQTGPETLTQVTPAQVDPNRVIVSEASALAYHSTLFEDFGLVADAVYNFYTADEQTDFSADPSSSLRDLPRYVQLSWRPAPTKRIAPPQTTKGMRPSFQDRVVEPVVPIGTAKGAVSNGYVAPGAVRALLVPPREHKNPPRFDQDLFLSSPAAAGRLASDHQHVNGEFHIFPVPPQSNRTRVNFVDPSIAGTLDQNRVAVSTDHAHLATLGAFAKLAAGLEVISEFNQDVPTRNPPPQFSAPADAPGLFYIGYVLERYTMDPNGSMTLSRTIDIDDLEQTSFVDREVVFGGRYSYRIRSIVQWTRPSTIGFTGISTLDRLPVIDTSLSSPTRRASFYSGDWSDWARAEVADNKLPDPPDEFTVRPVSHKRQIHVNWKMPGDAQRDISSLRLLRSEIRDGRYGDWSQIAEYVPANGMYIDRDVDTWEDSQVEYMYAMYSVSFHKELSVLSERFAVRLTDRSRYLGEEPVRLVGPRGDDPMAHARGPADPPDIEVVTSRRAVLYVRGGGSALPLFDRDYVVEVQSIATGQRVELDLTVDSTDVEMALDNGRRRT